MARSIFVVCAVLILIGVGRGAAAQEYSGIYVGVTAGGGIGTARSHTTTVFSPTGYFATTSVPAIDQASKQSLRAGGFSGGLQLGYDYPFQLASVKLVAGGELEASTLEFQDETSTGATYPCCSPTAFAIRTSVRTDSVSALRARIGVPLGRLLIFGTGGAAVGRVLYGVRFTDTFASALESAEWHEVRWGYAYGGGVEWRASRNLGFRLEVVRFELGTSERKSANFTGFSPPIAFPTNVFTHRVSVASTVPRLGAYWFF